METIFIILAIFWIVVPLAMKKKQQQEKQEAERQRAARANAQRTVQQPLPQQPIRTAPIAPSVRPAPSSVLVSREGYGSQQGNDAPITEGEPKHEVRSDLSTAKTTLSAVKTSITHTVTVSSESGHAHEETSASGIIAECPPDKTPAKQTAAPAAQASESAFVWDAEAVRNGLVMAEILGPCLAMRD